jgi:ubiquinone/menaquinone biosynthesis C-methylase UbiE
LERPDLATVAESNLLSDKYYDTETHERLTVRDACSLDEWLAGRRDARFAFHRSGFPVFLSPAEIASSDEYRDGDPYCAAEGLEQWPAFQERRVATTLRLVENVFALKADPHSLLDVACGEGVITAAIKRKFPAAAVFGIDYSLSAIERASRKFSDIEFAVGDAYRLPYAPESFDIAILNNVWEHVPDPLRLLDATKRVLRPSGYVIISTPSRYRFRNMVRVSLGMEVAFMSRMHVTEYTVGQVLEQLRFAHMEAKVIDEPLRGPAGGPLRFIAFKVVVPIIRAMLRLVGSHHSPEETVFFLARKVRL